MEENVTTTTVQNRYQQVKEAWKDVAEKHELYVNELADSEGKEEDSWISELSEMFDEIEIRSDKYLYGVLKKEKEEIEHKSNKELKEEETRQRQAQLKLVNELLIRRDQEGMKFYETVETTEKLLKAEVDTTLVSLADVLIALTLAN